MSSLLTSLMVGEIQHVARKMQRPNRKVQQSQMKMLRHEHKYAAHQTEKCSAPMDTRRIKQFPLLTTKGRIFPHALTERVVYSYLAYQDRISQCASIRKIAAETRLNGRTVAKALGVLGPLVLQEANRWAAVRPSGECAGWFAPRTARKDRPVENEEHWSDSYASMKLLLPRKQAMIEDRRFTVHHAAVYSLLVSLAGKHMCVEATSATHLSTMLNGMNVQTVSRALGLLEHAGLVHVFVDGARLNIEIRPLSEDHLALFDAAERKENRHSGVEKAEWSRPKYKNPIHDQFYDYCVCHGIPGPNAHEITTTASRAWDMDFQRFSLILDQADAEHRRNRMIGKFNSSHCGKLLLFKLNVWIGEQAAVYGIPDLDLAPKGDAPPLPKPRTREEELAHREAVAADPLHPNRQEVTALDITRRVGIERVKAAGVLDSLSRFLSERYKERTGADFMAACDFSLEMTPKIIGHALHALNRHYRTESKATLVELQEAINEALHKFEFEPMFERPPPPLSETDDKLDEALIERLLSESAMEGQTIPISDTGHEVSTSPDSTVHDPLDDLR